VRQILPLKDSGPEPDLAELYAYPAGDTAWIRANMVASADGAATLNGRSGGLAGAADRLVFGLLRAMADVILVGAGTVRAEAYRPARISERWSSLREGRPPSPPIAVVTRSLDFGPAGTLLTQAPEDGRTIVITTQSAPADRRAAVARDAELIIAGVDQVDLRAAVGALTAAGHRRILTEGGPHLLGRIAEAGLLDDLCLTISPLLAGDRAGRIIQGAGPLAHPSGTALGQLSLAHVLEDEGYLLCRYLRSAPAG
jgi:riboflavin biosynthesis pyrimidine reductase